jgi:hypothetical protein
MLGHIEPMKVIARILKMLLGVMQERLPTPSIPGLTTSGMEKMLTWKIKWIHARASSQIGIF